MALVRFLRERCQWDAAQTPRSLLPYMLEEAHEVAEAVVEEDDDELAAELGDLLLHLAFQLVLAEERGAFSPAEVAERVTHKMRRRHPHIYGDADSAEDWEALKDRERRAEGRSVLEGLARGLDPLSRAHRIQERV
ncbi:MAG: MazG nucleotide pyrophosphohydrolase domain-containing protein, partial [Gemmatimonadota bacterium]